MGKDSAEWQALNNIWKSLNANQRKALENDFKTVALSPKLADDQYMIRNIKGSFIYFLILNERVVYVGKTTVGISRPFSHYDKKFDSVRLIPCDANELDSWEQKYIEEYDPEYNKRGNDAVSFSEKEMKESLSNLYFPDKPLSKPKLRYLVSKAGVNPIIINSSWNFTHDMYEQIIAYIEPFAQEGRQREIFAEYTYQIGLEYVDKDAELTDIVKKAYENSANREAFIEYLSRYHVAVTKEGTDYVNFYYRNKMVKSTSLDSCFTKQYLYRLK